MITNLQTYLAIAKAAQTASEEALAAGQRPMPDGSPGVIVTYDPNQTSFRQSLVAIVFAGIYLEALLYIRGIERFGAAYRDSSTYESKLKALGITDVELIADVAQLRLIRNGIVHEKALRPSDITEFVAAQSEAARAIDLVERVTRLLCPV